MNRGRPTLEQSGLLPAHRKFIKHVLNGRPVTHASQLAGFGRQTGYDLMKNPAIQNELARQMEKVGITDNYLAKKIKQGLNARTAPQKDGGTRYDDQFVRKQWADIAIRVKGGYAPEKIQTEHKIIQLVIDGNMVKALKDSKALSKKEIEELEAIDHEEIIDAEFTEECESDGGPAGSPEEAEGGPSPGEGDGSVGEVSCEACEEGGGEEGTGDEDGDRPVEEARGQEVSGQNQQAGGSD